jgi:murein DD-endopeptidase MepM/ murein hydrolase activator NlpD
MTNKLKISLGNSLRQSIRQALLLTLKFSSVAILFLKKIFSKKTVVFVSKQKIKSYSIGPVAQIVMLLFVLYVGSLFTKSLRYNSVIEKKSVEISNLKKANQQFESEVESLNLNLQKINSYFTSISGYKPEETSNNANPQNINNKVKDIFGNLNLDKQDQKIAAKIADSNLILDNIKGATVKRINDLEQKVAITGLGFVGNKAVLRKYSNDSDNQEAISLNNKDELLRRQGGPFHSFKSTVNSLAGSKVFSEEKFSIKNEIEYLANLESFIGHIPLVAPIKDYYVSSGFGKRTDPMRGEPARHEGMDFVGKNGAKIFSPSPAKVIFAGKFSTYGNALILDHGYGITTRYGHLSKLYVSKGDQVTANQMIAVQGSTGRSTGQHLHYEVRYKNLPLNPKKFLQAGQEIFQN